MKGGNFYLTAKEKDMLKELIEAYYTCMPVSDADREILSKLSVKLEN